VRGRRIERTVDRTIVAGVSSGMTPPAPPLLLASASPRRKELLARAGIAFEVVPADVDETQRPGEPPAAYAERVAFDKAMAIAARRADAMVLAADTIVVIEDDVLGKPADDAQAASMLRRLAGHTHLVMTAVCVIAPG